ncbi:NAD(P)-dependent oxidoreductase [Leptospira tipperaryensis]|nr:D-isomer specific 2-hydroxyacid dehydrogenase family protein [Leptospira tipperaryensis]
MTILVLESWNFPDSSIDKLRKFGRVFLDKKEEPDKKTYIQEVNPDAIFIGLGVELRKEDLEKLKNLRVIVTPTTGLNHVDLETCEELEIKVISLKGEVEFLSSITSTAEHAWLLILSLFKEFRKDISNVNLNLWNRSELKTKELNGKTIGIIGYGRLGKIVREYSQSFRMKCLIYDIDPVKISEIPEDERSEKENLFKKSDVISLMASYKPENSRMIGDREFGYMKDGSFFVNTSRGELVDEASLLNHLKSGKLAGAALDVLDNDSSWNGRSPENHPLIEYSKNHHNLIITSHVGGNSKEALLKTREFVVNRFIEYIS